MEDLDNLPGETWKKLASRKNHSVCIDIPALDADRKPLCKIVIRTLTHDDHIAIQKTATYETDRGFNREEKLDRSTEVYQQRYENIAAKHFLFHACREPDNEKKPFFKTPEQVGQWLSNDEISMLMVNYRTLQNNTGPIIAFMNSDQLESYIEKIAKDVENSSYFLDYVLSETKQQLLIFMATELWKSRMDKSLPLSQDKGLSEDINPQ